MKNRVVKDIADLIRLALDSINKNFDDISMITGMSRDVCKKPMNDIFLKHVDLEASKSAHNYLEICVCVEGSMALQLQKGIYLLNSGDIAYIIPKTEYQKGGFKKEGYMALWFSVVSNQVYFHVTGKKIGSSDIEESHFVQCMPRSNMLINEIFEELREQTEYYGIMLKTLTVKFLTNILRYISKTEVCVGKPITNNQQIALKVENYINNNYFNNIKLIEISNYMNMSVNYLNTIFKSVTEMTIMQYLENFRIEKAKHLLINTDHSVQDIASELAFWDPAHFTKTFKRKTGYCPKKFKELAAIVQSSGPERIPHSVAVP